MSSSQNNDPYHCDRRDFMKFAGIGVAAMTVGGIALTSNASAADIGNVGSKVYDTDVLIVGGGVAATFAAVKARAQGARVTLVDKGYVGRSGLTPYFHGFAHYDPADPKKESIADWHHGIMWATESITRKDYVDMFLEDSKARWDEISSWVPQKALATGKGPYLRAQIEKSGTEIIEGVMITELLEKDGKVVGAIGIPRGEDKTIVFKAGAVILCTGAGTFKSPGWPSSPNTFDGHIMAYKIGAQIGGKEWNDFHDTSGENPGDAFGNHGGSMTRPMESPTTSTAHSLRSIFWSARNGVPAEGGRPGGPPPGSEGPGGGDDGGRPSGPPPGSEGGAGAGARPARPGGGRVLGAALGAAEHRMDGIFPADNTCWTGIDGLFAAGDAMCTGGVGTQGSSSPGGSAQGARAGVNAAKYASKNKTVTLSKAEITKVHNRVFAARTRKEGYSPQWVTRALQTTMMPYYVLYVKRQDRLEAALTNVLYLKEHFLPRLIAKDTHELRLALETENMIINAEMKLRASLFRKESRHSHYREDYPFRDDKNWLSFVLLQKDGDNMSVKKWEIPKEWIPESLTKMSYEEKYTDRFPGEAEYLKKHGVKS